MTALRVGRPPFIDTDIASSDNFYTKNFDNRSPANIVNRAYLPPVTAQNNGAGILSMDTLPGEMISGAASNGLLAAYATFDLSDKNVQVPYGLYGRAATHGAPGKLESYRTGWSPVESMRLLGPNLSQINMTVACQRKGKYGYILCSGALGPTVGGTQLIRVGAENVQPAMRGAPGSEIILQTPTTVQQGRPHASVLNTSYGLAKTQFFVSDDATPQAWFATDDSVFGEKTTSISTFMIGQDPGDRWAEFGAATASGQSARLWMTGQFGAYFQVYKAPADPLGIGPVLVRSWETAAPEVWYLVPERSRGYPTGRLIIYRSKWGAGNYRKPAATQENYGSRTVALTDDAAFTNGQSQYPRLNPHGYAFDHNWQTTANKLGVTNEFPYIRSFGGPGGYQDYWDANTPADFQPGWSWEVRVITDIARTNNFHIVLGARSFEGILFLRRDTIRAGSGYQQPGIVPVWLTTTGDYGKTWYPRGFITSVPALDAGQRINNGTALEQIGGAYMSHLTAAQTAEGPVVIGLNHNIMYAAMDGSDLDFYNSSPNDAGAHNALVPLTDLGVGVAKPGQSAVNFEGGTKWR